MKLVKVLAFVLTLCMMSMAFVACDKDGETEESGTTAATKVKVTLIVRDASGAQKYEDEVVCDGTLGDAIEMLHAAEDGQGECFDANGLLTTVGELTGTDWKAYDKEAGSNNAYESIKNQAVTEGQTIIVALVK